MNNPELIQWLRDQDACAEALEWVQAQPGQRLPALWDACPVGHWMLWLCRESGVPGDTLAPVAYRAADRAVREYTPRALERARLTEEAARLRALAPVRDRETAVAAADPAAAASRIGHATAMHAADAAAAAADPAAALAAALAAADAAAATDAADAEENQRCADDCRELLACPVIAKK